MRYVKWVRSDLQSRKTFFSKRNRKTDNFVDLMNFVFFQTIKNIFNITITCTDICIWHLSVMLLALLYPNAAIIAWKVCVESSWSRRRYILWHSTKSAWFYEQEHKVFWKLCLNMVSWKCCEIIKESRQKSQQTCYSGISLAFKQNSSCSYICAVWNMFRYK